MSLRVVPAVTILFFTTTFNLEDAAVVLEKWQNLAATAPDALSSVAQLSANGSSGVGVFAVNGEFRVEHGSVPAARQELVSILRTQWLDHLPPRSTRPRSRSRR